jgi:glycine hydroxymethyltransferase
MNPPASSAKTASALDSFFTATLAEADPEIAAAIRGELGRKTSSAARCWKRRAR